MRARRCEEVSERAKGQDVGVEVDDLGEESVESEDVQFGERIV